MTGKAVLRIDTNVERVHWNGQELAFRGKDGQRWYQFVLLLAQHFPHGDVSVDDIAVLTGFRTLIPTIVGKTVARYIRDSLNPQAGCNLVMSRSGKSEGVFFFNPNVVEQIEWFPPGTDRGDQSSAPMLEMTLEELQSLARAEALIESGQGLSVQTQLETHARNGSPAAAAQAMLSLANLALLHGQLRDASEWLTRVGELPITGQQSSLEQQHLHALAKLEFSDGHTTEARALLRRLIPLVAREDKAMRARVELFLGVLAVQEQQPMAVSRQALHRALELCFLVRWWWGVQAVYANLGLMCALHADQPTIQVNPELRRQWLTQARQWFDQALHFCTETGFHHQSVELLVWSARVRRLLGEVDRVGGLLDQAQALAQAARAKAEVQLELGEVAWHLGRHREANHHWTQALEQPLGAAERQTLRQRLMGRLES